MAYIPKCGTEYTDRDQIHGLLLTRYCGRARGHETRDDLGHADALTPDDVVNGPWVTEREEAIAQLRKAITDPGPRPLVHDSILQRHRIEWPTLWAAIDRLLKDPS